METVLGVTHDWVHVYDHLDGPRLVINASTEAVAEPIHEDQCRSQCAR